MNELKKRSGRKNQKKIGEVCRDEQKEKEAETEGEKVRTGWNEELFLKPDRRKMKDKGKTTLQRREVFRVKEERKKKGEDKKLNEGEIQKTLRKEEESPAKQLSPVCHRH